MKADRAMQSIVSKMPLCRAAAFAAGLGLAVLSCPVHAAPASSGDTVQGLYNALLSTMKNGRVLGQSGRFTLLEPVIVRTFDIASMARLAIGPTWAGLTSAQRQQATDSFGRYISATYADRFDSYAGQKLEVTGEQPAPFGVMVKSQIVKANGEPVKVDYLMRQNGDSWLISDIYLDSAISGSGDPPIRICCHPEEGRHRRSDRSSQPQGRHPHRDHGKSLVGIIPLVALH